MSKENILKNIDLARSICEENKNVKIVAVVSGNDTDKKAWQKRLSDANKDLFNSDNSTLVLSLQERIGEKTKEGNFLGTLLAYMHIKEEALKASVEYRDFIILLGMLFGRGERISPVTQAKGCRKPAIEVTSASFEIAGTKRALTAIEEALIYFAPVAKYLENRGFRGILNKWGDETEVASLDLSQEDKLDFSQYDIVKIISTSEVTDEKAKQKEWIISSGDGTILKQISRGRKEDIIESLRENNIQEKDGKYFAGVSLGPVAVSYDFLDVALDVFEDLITEKDVYFDFDPYFIMALAMGPDELENWDKKVKHDKSMEELVFMIPDFFTRVQTFKKKFEERFARPLSLKVLDLGEGIYWADIGQHIDMRKKFLDLTSDSDEGSIARRLAGISGEKDPNGNVIINSDISDAAVVADSVIVNSTITGPGKVTSGVILDSELASVKMDKAFIVRSLRLGNTHLEPKSGLFESYGKENIKLKSGYRHVSVLIDDEAVGLICTEEVNLRDKKNTYNVPILGNKISFNEAFDKMFGVSMGELQTRREKIWTKLKESK